MSPETSSEFNDQDTDDEPTISINELRRWLVDYSFIDHAGSDRIAQFIDNAIDLRETRKGGKS